ncbi:sigma-70 family RNA polymerase sigma factor [Bacillus lacus]|uniref:Sigma-70 family RNA polymerase sigma factor n=1 Tax=Metabacillus lacus TaxID=1983721 RepID=A0A7X2LYI8_9BACI|nr:sigma-70 family RNA polymerase sigma factor [Metabacillus lacus]MRX71888.1 sigma-70 family RNA polymerase sigma factor [Metabacillus lacus]
MVDIDDAALYKRSLQKDKIAFEALYDRYEKLLYSFAYKMTRDESLAEEVVQDIFLKLWNEAEKYDESKGKFSSWLLTMARFKAIDLIRKNKRHEHFELLEKDDARQPAASAAEEVEWQEERSSILAAVKQLKKDQQKIIDLFYFKGLSQQNISNQCEIPLGTVKGRIRLALKHLRDHMSAEGRDLQ